MDVTDKRLIRFAGQEHLEWNRFCGCYRPADPGSMRPDGFGNQTQFLTEWRYANASLQTKANFEARAGLTCDLMIHEDCCRRHPVLQPKTSNPIEIWACGISKMDVNGV